MSYAEPIDRRCPECGEPVETETNDREFWGLCHEHGAFTLTECFTY